MVLCSHSLITARLPFIPLHVSPSSLRLTATPALAAHAPWGLDLEVVGAGFLKAELAGVALDQAPSICGPQWFEVLETPAQLEAELQ